MTDAEREQAAAGAAQGAVATVTDVPLVVDLDGTLIKSDVLWESLMLLMRDRPWALIRALRWLSGGKASFKAKLVAEVALDPAALPYRDDVLAFVHAARGEGRRVVLATATHQAVADLVAGHLGVFDEVLGTEGQTNLGGATKRHALEQRYGNKGFDYMGDHRRDIPIFAGARSAHLVGASSSVEQAARTHGNVDRVFPRARGGPLLWLRAMRIHQWVKNALLFLPLTLAHRLTDFHDLLRVSIAFVAFGLVASSTYQINDLRDLAADRRHARKRTRALASGDLSIPAGLTLAAVAFVSGFAVALAWLPAAFAGILAGYTVLTLVYSFELKRRLLVDIIALALLYTLRIVAGGAAAGVVVSEWLLAFSLFFFTNLAFLKRYIELRQMLPTAGGKVAGRGYVDTDANMIRSVGPSTGTAAVLVMALYINGAQVQKLYPAAFWLWLIVPILIYWNMRVWFLAERGEVDHDPVVFALRDRVTWAATAAVAVIAVLATIG